MSENYATTTLAAQGLLYDDPEDHRDLPLMFRWHVDPSIRSLTAIPWTGRSKADHVISGVAAELMAVAGTDKWLSVSLNKHWYARHPKICRDGYGYDLVRGALTRLKAGGLIEMVKGERAPGGSGIQTVIRPTDRFTEIVGSDRTVKYRLRDPVVMKDASGAVIPVPDARALDRVRRHIERRNESFAANNLRLDAPDVAWTPDRPMQIDGVWIDPRRNQAHAVYNTSASLGGRWYGLWYQTLKNKDQGRRAQLTMNGRPVDEPDFSGCHPLLLWHQRGLEPDFDDLYEVEHPVYGRPDAKLSMQCLINATGRQNALWGFCYRMAGDAARAQRKAGGPKMSQEEIDAIARGHRPGASRLFEALERLHAPIADAFYSGAGIRLQNVETKIMTRAALDCLDRGIVVYPMHDSAITGAGADADILREAMARSYVSETGFEPRIG